MLLKNAELDAIKAGKVSLVFRRWRKPSVKTGGTLKTKIGVLNIVDVKKIERSKLASRDAGKAGYASAAEVLSILDEHVGDFYRIELLAGPDPRIALRENDQISSTEMTAMRTKLARWDAASREGPWTRQFLQLIARHPNVAAVTLAKIAGHERAWLKLNVRKLKNLGLTISHHPGYELSPRGKAVLRNFEKHRH